MSKDAENPYEVEFRHNAFGDVYGEPADGLVAFNLDSLPDTEGKTVKLKLKWNHLTERKQRNLIIVPVSQLLQTMQPLQPDEVS